MDSGGTTSYDPSTRATQKNYGIGAVNYHTGQTFVIFRKRKRRKEIAEFLTLLLEEHPNETVYIAWDKVNTHMDYEVEAVLRGAAGRLILIYLPTYSPWLNPIEMLWRHFRRQVTHCELFQSVEKLIEASKNFFERHNLIPEKVLSIIGSNAITRQNLFVCT